MQNNSLFADYGVNQDFTPRNMKTGQVRSMELAGANGLPTSSTMPVTGGTQPLDLTNTGPLGNDVIDKTTGGANTGTAAWTNDPQFSGMAPWLKDIYTKGNLTPSGRGTGFADWQYWQNDALNNAKGDVGYITNRLSADIAGTGTDQPTGTPGSGAWMSSGKGGGGAATGGGGGVSTTGSNLSGFMVNPFSASKYDPSQSPIFGASSPTSKTQEALFNRLMGLADTSTNVSPDDPVIKAQTDAFRAEADRGTRNYLSAAAEKGGQTSNMDAAARSANEKAAQATAGFQGQAMVTELGARRQQIMQALSGAAGLLTSEQSMMLQDELGKLDAQLSAWGTQQNLGANESMFARNLAQNAYEFDTNQYNQLFGG